jgi:hypothetical protein
VAEAILGAKTVVIAAIVLLLLAGRSTLEVYNGKNGTIANIRMRFWLLLFLLLYVQEGKRFCLG